MQEIARHEENVARLVIRISEEIGLSVEHIGEIQLAALIHDIGKVGIPPEILDKTQPISEQDYAIIKSHSILGWNLANWTGMSRVATWIRHHHERFDGDGYPDGLKAFRIPLESRIIHIADMYDAIVSDRPYRKARSHEWAMTEIRRCSGTQLCPIVVRAIEEVMKRREIDDLILPRTAKTAP
jgi:HD-GYP domain-containing protein (c-di-GMP phosphodiesterase class II)